MEDPRDGSGKVPLRLAVEARNPGPEVIVIEDHPSVSKLRSNFGGLVHIEVGA